jgi:microcystin-dependent protein
MQPSLGVTYIIAVDGVFPSRDRRDLETQEGETVADGDDLGLREHQSHRRLGELPYVGEVAMFAGNFAPRGWAKCEGQLLTIFDNEALFSLLGTTYGGNGQTNFGMPDLRGRVPIGTDSNFLTADLGEMIGSETTTLTTNNLPSHTHGVKDIVTISGLAAVT